MEESEESGRVAVAGGTESDCPQKIYKKLSRKNTRKEKVIMNKLRRKRKKCQKTMKARIQHLQKEVTSEKDLRKKAEKSVFTYRNISRTYWERWRWELSKRREALLELKLKCKYSTPSSTRDVLLHEIDPSMLKDPLGEEKYVARGCFGIVRKQEYRNMQVAVKEFLPRSLVLDVKKEASILASLSHPYVPFLFGVCTKIQPLRIVMQYHTLCGLDVCTIEMELRRDRHITGIVWLVLCAQLMEAIQYLHEEVNILHNDIKSDNLLLSQSLKPEDDCQCQIVLIDFGKATRIAESRRYNLSAVERGEYFRKYPHIPPEVIEGDRSPHKGSDVYAAGKVLHKINDSRCIDSLDINIQRRFLKFAENCCYIDYTKRPSSKECLKVLEKLIK